jgi:hypothetical protein
MPRASYYPKSGSMPPRMEVQQVDFKLLKNKQIRNRRLSKEQKIDACRKCSR